MKIAFIGNSHCAQFNIENYNNKDITIDIINWTAASIKGLVNKNSKLQFGNHIKEYCEVNKDTTLVFFLGQVDIEFGYYYKCVINNTKYDVNIYINELIENYKEYLNNNITNKFYILSINPTTIRNIEHNFWVSFRCPNGRHGFYSDPNEAIKFEDYKDTIYNDDYGTRFNINKLFNERLETMCINNNFKYINFWNIIMDDEKTIKSEYMPEHNDHHLRKNNKTELLEYILNNMK